MCVFVCAFYLTSLLLPPRLPRQASDEHARRLVRAASFKATVALVEGERSRLILDRETRERRSRLLAEMGGGRGAEMADADADADAADDDEEEIGSEIGDIIAGCTVKRVGTVSRVKWALGGSGRGTSTSGDNGSSSRNGSNGSSSGIGGGFGSVARALVQRRQSIAAAAETERARLVAQRRAFEAEVNAMERQRSAALR